MKIFFIIIIFLNTFLYSKTLYSDKDIKKMISKMIILGFNGLKINKDMQIYKDIENGLGGVILFDKNIQEPKQLKNIKNPRQLKKLTLNLQNITKEKLIISLDQEGGKVQRLKKINNFTETPSANLISHKNTFFAKKEYEKLATTLKENGINLNFAPVVDLAINKNNLVINKLERSYGNSEETIKYANIFIEKLKKENILYVLKHFPGHGSSKGDSHKGFTDTTNTWNKKELLPYEYFIKNNKAKIIMTAHIFNRNLDSNYPATLSYKTNTLLLRNKMNFKGIIISDDLQMKAISDFYTTKKAVTLAINSGVNILLFGNQLVKTPITLDEIVDIIFTQIKNNKIPLDKIINSYKKINSIF